MAEFRDDPLSAAMRWWPLVAVSILVCAVGLGAAAGRQPTTWTSTATVVYGGGTSDLLSGAAESDMDAQRALATQAQVVLGDQVMASAGENLGVPLEQLIADTTVEDLADTNIITISVTGPTAAEAARRTQGVANGYIEYTASLARDNLNQQAASLDPEIRRLRRQIAKVQDPADTQPLDIALSALLQKQIQLSSAASAESGPARLIAAAQPSDNPSSTSIVTGCVIGAGIGLVLGIGLALLLGRWRPGSSTSQSGPAGNRGAATGLAHKYTQTTSAKR